MKESHVLSIRSTAPPCPQTRNQKALAVHHARLKERNGIFHETCNRNALTYRQSKDFCQAVTTARQDLKKAWPCKKNGQITILHKNDFLIQMSHQANATFQQSLSNKKKPCLITTHFVPLFKFNQKNPIKNDLSILRNFDLSHGAEVIAKEENAGGNSVISEVLSFEFMKRAFGAELEHTEMQLQYFPIGSKKTDYSIKLDGERIGVSVTRAMHFLNDELFTERDAEMLLKKKLNGVNISSQNIVKKHKWERQILHIFTRTEKIAKTIENVYRKLKSDYRTNTIVVITVAPNCNFLFWKNIL